MPEMNIELIEDRHAGILGYASDDPELLRQCAASGQMDASQIAQHFPPVANHVPATDTRVDLSRASVAFAIADRAMFDVIKNGGVPHDEHWTVFGLVDESYREVTVLQQASPAMRAAFDWLQPRGYVELGRDKDGEFVNVIRRPGEE